MKKTILFAAICFSVVSITVSAYPPQGKKCKTAGEGEVNNGYCTSIYDADGNITYQCLDPQGSNVTKDCLK